MAWVILHSAAKALEHVGATVDVTNDPKLIAQADKIVFPGVGAMRDCMQGMHEAGIDEVVRHAAFNKPVLSDLCRHASTTATLKKMAVVEPGYF
jgi:imidazoleglycerol phosphate synthase glutamine amidotransferase subunit HisH